MRDGVWPACEAAFKALVDAGYQFRATVPNFTSGDQREMKLQQETLSACKDRAMWVAGAQHHVIDTDLEAVRRAWCTVPYLGVPGGCQ